MREKQFFLLSMMLVFGGPAVAAIDISCDREIWIPSDLALVTVSSDMEMVGGFSGFVAIDLSSAEANAEWTGTYEIQIILPPDPPGLYYVEYLGDMTDTYGVPWDGWLVELTSPSPVPNPPSDIITFEIHCPGIGIAELLVADNMLTELDRTMIMEVPEPAGMLLLGMGGFLIRRRK